MTQVGASSVGIELEPRAAALIAGLKPTIRFDAISVFVIDGEYARLHSLHVERVGRRPGESVESVIARASASVNLPPQPVIRQRLKDHHVSQVASTLQPYVCADLESQKRFSEDEKMLQHGVRSYISLPLLKHGALLGTVDFISFEKRSFNGGDVQLLQDVSEIVSIAVCAGV